MIIMKKFILTILAIATVSTLAFAAEKSNASKQEAAPQNVAAEAQSNFTSIGNNWVGAGFGFAFQTDTGLIGYAEGQYAVWSKDEFALDVRGNAEYADMTTQTFNLGIDALPSYKFYTYKGIDIAVFADVGVGYGTLWYESDGYSMISYRLGTGVEFSYQNIYVRPSYTWVNYDPFNDYNTVSNHVVGVEAGWKLADKWVLTGTYSHWFSEDINSLRDNEDRLTVGVRYLF